MSASRQGTTSRPLCQMSIIARRSTCLPQMDTLHTEKLYVPILRKSLFFGHSVLSDIRAFIWQNPSVNVWVWIVWVCNLDMNRLQSSQTWLLDVRDLNNRRYSFQKPAQMKIHPHYSWHQTGWGPKRAHLQLNVGGSGDSGLFSMCLCCRGGGGMEEERVPVGHSWCATVSTFYLPLSQLTGWDTTRD